MWSPQEQVVKRKKKVKAVAGKNVTNEDVTALEELEVPKCQKKQMIVIKLTKKKAPFLLPVTTNDCSSQKP